MKKNKPTRKINELNFVDFIFNKGPHATKGLEETIGKLMYCFLWMTFVGFLALMILAIIGWII